MSKRDDDCDTMQKKILLTSFGGSTDPLSFTFALSKE